MRFSGMVDDVKDAKVNDKQRVGVSREALAQDAAALLRRPPVIGTVAGVVGLVLGVLIGRASVGDLPADPDASKVTETEQKSLVAEKPSTLDKDDEEPYGPSPSFGVYFDRRLPASARGFERIRGGDRPAARLTSADATVTFEILAKSEPYAFTSVLSVEGSKKATLNVLLDGQPLGAMTLTPGWQVYSSSVPSAALTDERHTLTLRLDRSVESPVVSIASLAVAPAGSEVSLDMGERSGVALIDGFGKPAATHVWNEGERSTFGVVLSPSGKDYRLTVTGKTLSQLGPLTVNAKVNGTSVGTAVFEKNVTEPTWSVPAKALQSGVNRVELSYPKTLKPSQLKPNSKDNRALAVRFTKLELKPAQ